MKTIRIGIKARGINQEKKTEYFSKDSYRIVRPWRAPSRNLNPSGDMPTEAHEKGAKKKRRLKKE